MRPQRKRSQYPPRKCIAIDVDDTLLIQGEINTDLVAWIRKRHGQGYSFILWSARGEDHARSTAERAGIPDLFVAIVSKPSFIVDDRGWSWTRHTRAIHPDEISEA